jgi:FMN phosphatase YigB (HAD superfamily)
MTQKNYFIFDMDGTLYKFDKGRSENFKSSAFYAEIKRNAFVFLAERLGVTLDAAEKEYERIRQKYNGELSLGVEKEHGISRYEYFENTWDLIPGDFICSNYTPAMVFMDLKGRAAVLTSAPRVWAVNALKYLKVYNSVKNALFTGEPDIRKPNPEAFMQIADFFGVPPQRIYSVGDQEKTDIIPAKSLGMKTILIGGKSEIADICLPSMEDFLKMLNTGELK